MWNVTATKDAIYAGVEPAGLFRSVDRGRTCTHVEGLTAHPSRSDWVAGAGGLILHTIVPHPTDPARTWVGISSVGVSRQGDGGSTWGDPGPASGPTSTRRSTRSWDSVSDKLGLASAAPSASTSRTICGVYRSDDGGLAWDEITEGLPTQFGSSSPPTRGTRTPP